MTFFTDLKTRAEAELKALGADGRAAEEKVLDYFQLGALHTKLTDLETQFQAEVAKLKASAEAKLKDDVAAVRAVINAQGAKLRADAAAVTTPAAPTK